MQSNFCPRMCSCMPSQWPAKSSRSLPWRRSHRRQAAKHLSGAFSSALPSRSRCREVLGSKDSDTRSPFHMQNSVVRGRPSLEDPKHLQHLARRPEAPSTHLLKRPPLSRRPGRTAQGLSLLAVVEVEKVLRPRDTENPSKEQMQNALRGKRAIQLGTDAKAGLYHSISEVFLL